MSRKHPNRSPQATESRIAVAHQQEFSGPLPPPGVLEHYNKVHPNAAERILTMAESQSQHRIDLEAKVINSDIARARLGLWFGFVLGLLVEAAGIVLIYTGKPVTGGILSGSTIIGLVAAFVYGSSTRRSQFQKRLDQ